jgi:hypothetical protein
MTFLNPFILFGLAAAAIPIILHLLNLRKLRTIEFSTLTFLKELQQTKIRRLKIRQILLLIVRTLLVIFIVLAFSRPALQGSFLGSIGTNAHSTVVLIVDDSFSMSASGERGELFHQAKERVQNIISLLKEGDDAFLIRLSDLPSATIEPATHDFSALSTVVGEATLSATTRSMEDALRLSARLLSTSKNANQEVYLFSDFQRTLFPPDAGSNAAMRAALFGPGVRFFTIDAGGGDVSNLGVDSVVVRSQILEKEKPVQITATVTNYSAMPVQRAVVSVYLDDTRLAQNSIDAGPWSSSTVELTVTPSRTGHIRGRVVIEDDAIGEDNQRFFTLTIPEKITILCVAATPSDIRYPLMALQSEGSTHTASLLDIRQSQPGKLSLSDMRDVDVMLVSGLSGLGESAAEIVAGFVQRGGGLILFPEPGYSVPPASSSFLLSKLKIPPPQSVSNSASGTTSLSFRRVDQEHPLFHTVFEKEESNAKRRVIESPAIVKSLLRQPGKEGSSVIELGDGSPFLSEHKSGKGRVLFYSVAPELAWSDFPLKALFAPLIYRSVVYAASTSRAEQSAYAGDDVVVKIPSGASGSSGERFRFVAPDRTDEIVLPRSSGLESGNDGELVFGPLRLRQPGVYALNNGPAIASLVAVNANPLESDTRAIEPDELVMVWEHLGIPESSVRSLTPGDQVETAVMESRFGVELWKHALLLALLMALLEMLIARDSRKEMQQAAAAAGVS